MTVPKQIQDNPIKAFEHVFGQQVVNFYCPICKSKNKNCQLSVVIMHLNDKHKYTRNQIADFIDTLGEFPVLNSLNTFHTNDIEAAKKQHPAVQPYTKSTLTKHGHIHVSLKEQANNKSKFNTAVTACTDAASLEHEPEHKLLEAFKILFNGQVHVENNPLNYTYVYQFVSSEIIIAEPTTYWTTFANKSSFPVEPTFKTHEITQNKTTLKVSYYIIHQLETGDFAPFAIFHMRDVLNHIILCAPEALRPVYLKSLQKIEFM
jgi:hypothetical protein